MSALVFIHIFWKADGGSKPPGCDCGDMARVGEHTRPRVSSLAPSPKTFGCDRERWTQKVSGGGAGNSTRGRLRSPPLARRFGLTALASRFVYKNQASMPEALGLHQKSLNILSSPPERPLLYVFTFSSASLARCGRAAHSRHTARVRHFGTACRGINGQDSRP